MYRHICDSFSLFCQPKEISGYTSRRSSVYPLAPRFPSCAVTLPSAAGSKHCLSGHAWLCTSVFLCLCGCHRVPTNQPMWRKGGHEGAGGGIRDGAHTPELTERICGGESQGRRVIKERQQLKKNRQREERGSTRQSLVRGQEHRSV